MTFSNERTTSGEQAVDLQEGYNPCISVFWLLLFNILNFIQWEPKQIQEDLVSF